MTGISFTGIGSGLEVSTIVDAMVSAESVPYESRMATLQGAYTTDISAVGALKSALEDVTASFGALGDEDEYQQRTISGRDDFVSLSSDKEAEVGNYSVEVLALATQHKLLSSAIDGDEAVGEGTLSFASGDNTFDIVVSDTDTLSDIRDAINDSSSNSSVSATIITDSSGQHLVLNSKKTGLDNAITVNATEQSNKLTSVAGFTSTDTVGSGTLSFASGSNNFDIAVGATDTLSDIVTAINDSEDNTSVVARIVTDGTGQHLVFNSIEPGTANAVTVTAADSDGSNGDLNGISQFASVNMDVPSVSNSDMTGLSRLSSDTTNKLTSVNGFDSNDTVGSGTLSFSSDGNRFDVNISATDKLDDIVDAINNNGDNTSIKASIVIDDAGDEHLMFSSRQSGDVHAITVTALDDDGDDNDMSGISQFSSVNQTATANIGHMSEVDAAADASIIIDGTIAVTNSENTFKDVIDGVTITANKVHDVGDDISRITITEDNDNVAAGINTFVESFNALVALSDQLGSSSESGGGALSGDSLLRGVMTKIRSQFNQAFDSGNDTTLTLSQLGIRTERDGTLSFEQDTLDDLIEESPDRVQTFFLGAEGDNGFVNNMDEFLGFYTDSDGIIQQRMDGKTAQLDKLDTEYEAFQLKMESLEARLLSQYNAMDLIVAQLSSTGSYLLAQLENMPGVVKSSS
ncbi:MULTISPECIES: flagellar filament capping protein FliD [unclassified Colwellia]|uniref:flagellar filament capping protein FliD n=1 Tax=unclassified Colwellia TaxID=196834 RepID=UPI001C0A0AF3|nr:MULTISPECIES: flagellar filament capping protein FliD [unclassified Colwellia]MBU2925307.1 flagellar filament capping protein FliD [Colwellia sp. C2M11]MDO6651168.1 flagellar filament capping protein FliD [Colwellia sp. 3_MG-2023]MDO6664409.1 flagellar filament capping protein FliD [Colwellia sp. 2_MG-2023]